MGLALGHTGPCAAPWARPKKINDALESAKGYIVSGCWELKRKFWLNVFPMRAWAPSTTEEKAFHVDDPAGWGLALPLCGNTKKMI